MADHGKPVNGAGLKRRMASAGNEARLFVTWVGGAALAVALVGGAVWFAQDSWSTCRESHSLLYCGAKLR